MVKTIVRINGMKCEMCEAHMNDVIRTKFFVTKVTSSHKRGETVIISENQINETEIEKVINETGYQYVSCSCVPYEHKLKIHLPGRK